MKFTNLSLGQLANGIVTYIVQPGGPEENNLSQTMHDLEGQTSTLAPSQISITQPTIFNVEHPNYLNVRAHSRAQNFVSLTSAGLGSDVCASLAWFLKKIGSGAKIVTRELAAVTAYSSFVAGSAAAVSAAGNAVLIASNHDGYDINKGMYAYLTGSAVLSAPTYLLVRASLSFNRPPFELKNSLFDTCLNILGSMAGAALGNTILQSTGIDTLSTQNAAMSTAVGSAIINGGLLTLYQLGMAVRQH